MHFLKDATLIKAMNQLTDMGYKVFETIQVGQCFEMTAHKENIQAKGISMKSFSEAARMCLDEAKGMEA